MQKVKVYDLRKRAFLFSLEVIGFIKNLPNNYIAQTIGKQLLRSATSVGANIIEAQASPSKKDFANFYNIALKSANESKYWLMLLDQAKVGNQQTIAPIFQELEELSKILAKSLLTMRGK